MKLESFFRDIRNDYALCVHKQHLLPSIEKPYQQHQEALALSLVFRIFAIALAILSALDIFKSVVLLSSVKAVSLSTMALTSLAIYVVCLTLIHDMLVIGMNIASIHRIGLNALFATNNARQLNLWSAFVHTWRAISHGIPNGGRHLACEMRGVPAELYSTWVVAPMYKSVKNLMSTLR